MISTIALDAATCRVKWRHRWQTARRPADSSAIAASRIKDGRVVRGTPDGYLLALNAETGAPLWARQVAKPAEGETFTHGAGRLRGPGADRTRRQREQPAGLGRRVPRCPTARRSGGSTRCRNRASRASRPGRTRRGSRWAAARCGRRSRSTPRTATCTSRSRTRRPICPVHLRQGDNLYTNSIVVLDVRTGKLRWHRQLVPNDSHDWDVTHATPMITTTVNGSPRRLVMTTAEGRHAARAGSRDARACSTRRR